MNNRLFVGNLSFSTTENELETLFTQFGEVTETKIITDRETGRSRGFAFLTMTDDDAMKAAIEQMNGQMHNGRPLRVSEAEARQERSGGGGGGGGFGRPRSDRGPRERRDR